MDIVDINDGAEIIYRIEPVNFSDKSPAFTPESGTAAKPGDTLNVEVCWPDCEKPDDIDLYKFYLIVEDDACPSRNIDSVLVFVHVDEEDNVKPQIEIEEAELSAAVGEDLELWLFGSDFDLEDTLRFSYTILENESGGLPANNLVQLNEGNPIDGWFSFLAACKDLNAEAYVFRLRVSDNSCAGNNTDSLDLKILVDEYIPSELVIEEPTNVITPNGDGLNDYFFFNRPPPSACEFQEFEKVVIYNRWGREIFSSTDRDFKWYAVDVPSGEYFYLIQFEQTGYKGFIHVLK
jgi:gliding motility-associated-like protein